MLTDRHITKESTMTIYWQQCNKLTSRTATSSPLSSSTTIRFPNSHSPCVHPLSGSFSASNTTSFATSFNFHPSFLTLYYLKKKHEIENQKQKNWNCKKSRAIYEKYYDYEIFLTTKWKHTKKIKNETKKITFTSEFCYNQIKWINLNRTKKF